MGTAAPTASPSPAWGTHGVPQPRVGRVARQQEAETMTKGGSFSDKTSAPLTQFSSVPEAERNITAQNVPITLCKRAAQTPAQGAIESSLYCWETAAEQKFPLCTCEGNGIFYLPWLAACW